MGKVYKLVKDYHSPNRTICKGVTYTTDGWIKEFPTMSERNFGDYPEWFEEVVEKEFVLGSKSQEAAWVVVLNELRKKGLTDECPIGVSPLGHAIHFIKTKLFTIPQPTANDVLNKKDYDGKGRGKEWGTAFERLAYWGTHSGWKYFGDEVGIKLSHFEHMVDQIQKETTTPSQTTTIQNENTPHTYTVDKKIEVVVEQDFWDATRYAMDDKGSFKRYGFKVYSDNGIDEKLPAIKEAIEKIINS